MTSYLCPVCETFAAPAAQVGAVVVCGHCHASLVVEPDDYATRRATTADTAILTAAELQTLRKARGRPTR